MAFNIFRQRITRRRAGVIALTALVGLSACDPTAMSGGSGPGSGDTVQVALLVPTGSGDPNVSFIGQSLTNAAKLAVADLDGVSVDLRVYDTAGSEAQAAALAAQAVNEGAQVILGPLYAQEANAAGNAVAASGVNVLSFSNNAAIAGGNVFILGPTFDNTADRLVRFAQRRGKSRFMVVSGQSGAETVGRDAIVRAVQGSGAQLVGNGSFEMSQQGVTEAAPGIASQAIGANADAIFLTSGPESALPFLVQALPANGLTRDRIQYIGLTRWDVPASALTVPGLQGGWYAVPDPVAAQQFANRYSAAYGTPPHNIAGLAYDGIAAIGALTKAGRGLSKSALTQGSGFAGATGVFRFLQNGSNERGLAIATVDNNRVNVIDQAPRRLGGAGF
jgi:ABC-type branched-subunit amino acid transport system substrate-binding protein